MENGYPNRALCPYFTCKITNKKADSKNPLVLENYVLHAAFAHARCGVRVSLHECTLRSPVWFCNTNQCI
jgi:hypothetical protein